VIVVVMGVSGSGKSTVGALLAERLGVEFLDADEFHPPENVAKMAAGVPLTDADRRPWLERLNAELQNRKDAVLACSALKESYRRTLAQGVDCRFVHLRGPIELIRARMQERRHRYMPASLLESQFAALEPPAGAIEVDIALPAEDCVAKIAAGSVAVVDEQALAESCGTQAREEPPEAPAGHAFATIHEVAAARLAGKVEIDLVPEARLDPREGERPRAAVQVHLVAYRKPNVLGTIKQAVGKEAAAALHGQVAAGPHRQWPHCNRLRIAIESAAAEQAEAAARGEGLRPVGLDCDVRPLSRHDRDRRAAMLCAPEETLPRSEVAA
jgi:gluconokinase